ncbi:MAG: hypothetical protein QMD66_06730 [Actinomycetota bacterium]|nr:hypothetical protein [Actinomycetota bacterium]
MVGPSFLGGGSEAEEDGRDSVDALGPCGMGHPPGSHPGCGGGAGPQVLSPTGGAGGPPLLGGGGEAGAASRRE